MLTSFLLKDESGRVVVVIITWEGTDPSLPSIMLNSHIDVVPVFPVSYESHVVKIFYYISQLVRAL